MSPPASSSICARSLLALAGIFLLSANITSTVLVSADPAQAAPASSSRQQQVAARNFMMLPGRPLMRTFSLLSSALSIRPKITPLYLINGTICRYINAQPICTVLATTGLRTSGPTSATGGGVGGGGGSGGGGGAGAARPQSAGSPSGGSGASQTGGRPPTTAGQSSSGSSVQYVGRPLADDALDLQMANSVLLQQQQSGLSADGARPVGVLVRRRPLGLFSLVRRPPMWQLQQQPAQVK